MKKIFFLLTCINCLLDASRSFKVSNIFNLPRTSTIDPLFLHLVEKWIQSDANDADERVKSNLHEIDTRTAYNQHNIPTSATTVYVGAIIDEKQFKPNLLRQKSIPSYPLTAPERILKQVENKNKISSFTLPSKSTSQVQQSNTFTPVERNIAIQSIESLHRNQVDKSNVKPETEWKVLHPTNKTIHGILHEQIPQESQLKTSQVALVTSTKETSSTGKRFVTSDSIVVASPSNIGSNFEKRNHTPVLSSSSSSGVNSNSLSCSLIALIVLASVFTMALLLLALMYLAKNWINKMREHKFICSTRQRDLYSTRSVHSTLNPRVNFQRSYRDNWMHQGRQVTPMHSAYR